MKQELNIQELNMQMTLANEENSEQAMADSIQIVFPYSSVENAVVDIAENVDQLPIETIELFPIISEVEADTSESTEVANDTTESNVSDVIGVAANDTTEASTSDFIGIDASDATEASEVIVPTAVMFVEL